MLFQDRASHGSGGHHLYGSLCLHTASCFISIKLISCHHVGPLFKNGHWLTLQLGSLPVPQLVTTPWPDKCLLAHPCLCDVLSYLNPLQGSGEKPHLYEVPSENPCPQSFVLDHELHIPINLIQGWAHSAICGIHHYFLVISHHSDNKNNNP